MSEQSWYIYQNEQQLGPFTTDQVNQLSVSNMVAEDAFLFRAGWEKWRPIKECSQELDNTKKTTGANAAKSSLDNRQKPRALVKGRVIVHNNGDIDFTSGVNISETGIFIHTKNSYFKVGDNIRVTIQVKQLSKSYNTSAKVVRHNEDERWNVGFGLMFMNADSGLIKEIQEMFAEEDDMPTSKVG